MYFKINISFLSGLNDNYFLSDVTFHLCKTNFISIIILEKYNYFDSYPIYVLWREREDNDSPEYT